MLGDTLRRWDAWLSVKGHSDKTRRMYRRNLVNFWADTFLIEQWSHVTEDDVVDYLATLSAKGDMRGQIIRALRSFYPWAEERGLAQNPVREISVPPKKYGPPASLSIEEITRLLIAAAVREQRRAWAILLLYVTGARLSSLAAVEREDVYLRDPAHVRFRVVKGGRPYAVSLGKIGMGAAGELVKLGLSPLVGVGPSRLRQWVTQAGQDCGFRAYPHILRHSFASHLVERGADLRTVQDLGGWASLEMLTRYAAVSDRRKREAVELLG